MSNPTEHQEAVDAECSTTNMWEPTVPSICLRKITGSALGANDLATAANYECCCTTVEPRCSNHTFNGVFFDVRNHGYSSIIIRGFWVVGKGNLSVYTTDAPCTPQLVRNGKSWRKIATGVISGLQQQDIMLWCDGETVVLPGTGQGFYIHSEVWGDDGVRYQSYNKKEMCGRTEHVGILPFCGHTTSVPFATRTSWSYRSTRGLAGGLVYNTTPLVWSPAVHNVPRKYPIQLKACVKYLLLLHCVTTEAEREMDVGHQTPLGWLIADVLLYSLEYLNWEWFVGGDQKISKTWLIWERKMRLSGNQSLVLDTGEAGQQRKGAKEKLKALLCKCVPFSTQS
eukprot:TRINITY_DN67151_c6_g1_i1.p1 TRINITY_DN67151_c6_g1~~TRINITY_DN67151_c6_g1_i1.p1  ORF type:complete len:340 (+),score=31.81 TRINITY_DN67151_c6_g1_i1:34-1053(+)